MSCFWSPAVRRVWYAWASWPIRHSFLIPGWWSMLVCVFHLAASRHWRPSGPTLNYQKKGFFIAYTTRERQSCASSWVPAAISQSQRLFTTPWSASYSSTWPCEKWMDQEDAVNGFWCGTNSCGWLHIGEDKENVAFGATAPDYQHWLQRLLQCHEQCLPFLKHARRVCISLQVECNSMELLQIWVLVSLPSSEFRWLRVALPIHW